jgi:hypothetical protein
VDGDEVEEEQIQEEEPEAANGIEESAVSAKGVRAHDI